MPGNFSHEVVNDFYRGFDQAVKDDFKENSKIQEEIHHMLVVFNEYSHTLMANNDLKTERLEEVLSYRVNVNDLQKYISGSLLSFYCLLISSSFQPIIEGLVETFLRILRGFDTNLQEYGKSN